MMLFAFGMVVGIVCGVLVTLFGIVLIDRRAVDINDEADDAPYRLP